MSIFKSRSVPVVLFGIAIALALALNLWARRHNYFFYDEYEIVLHRYSLHDLLEPTNGHPMIMWLPLFYLLREVFGLDSALPFELVAMVAMVGATIVLFAYLSSRAGRWVALAGATIVLFIGSGSDILFWPFQLAFAGSVGAGLGALLVLSAGRRRGDVAAAALLVASVFFLAVGLAFVAAAATAVAVASGTGQRLPLRRLALVAGPALALYTIWYLAFGHHSPSRVSVENLLGAPLFVVNGIGASLAAIAGLAGDPAEPTAIAWGIPLLVAIAGLVAWRGGTGRRIAPAVWIGVAGALAFWALTGVNKPLGATPDTGRYAFIGAIFAMLVLAGFVRGLPIGRVLAGLASALVLVSVVGNLAGYRYGHNVLLPEAENTRATLGALDIARDRVDPGFQLTPEVSGSNFLIVVDAASYFKSEDRYGSPAFSPSQLTEQREPLRTNVDSVLLAALPVTLRPVEEQPPHFDCNSLRADEGNLALRTGMRAIWLRGSGDEVAEIGLSRFGDAPRPVGTIRPGEAARLSIPPDRSSLPWKLGLAKGVVRICRG